MKLILRETVGRLGKACDIVDVADGYARNFLIPKRLGVVANIHNVGALEHEKRLIQNQVESALAAASAEAEKIGALQLTIPARVTEEGHLYGSVTAADIAEAISAQGIPVDKHQVLLPRGIKELGTHEITVAVRHDITVQVKAEIVQADKQAT